MKDYLKAQIDGARIHSVTFLDFYRQLQRRGVSIMVVTAHAEEECDTTPKLIYFFKDASYEEMDLGENYSYCHILNLLHTAHASISRPERQESRESMQVS